MDASRAFRTSPGWDRLNEWMVTTGQLKESADVTGTVSNDYLPAQ